jgi:hypothetical protein
LIELIDINLRNHLNTIYNTEFLYSSQEDNDYARWKEMSERKGFEMDLPVGAFHREPSSYDRSRFNFAAKKYGHGLVRTNFDRTIGSSVQFVPVDLNYKVRLYSYSFAEMINFERASWFDLQDSILSVIFPVHNSQNTFNLPMEIENHSAPEEAQPFRKSRSYRLSIDLNVKGWVVNIKDTRLVHQTILELFNYTNDTDMDNPSAEELLLDFYYGTRVWD